MLNRCYLPVLRPAEPGAPQGVVHARFPLVPPLRPQRGRRVTGPLVRGVELGRRVAGGVEKRLRVVGDRMRVGAAPARIGDRLRDAYAGGWHGTRCAFVCSTGRVGTLTLTRLLALAPEVHAVHEPLPRMIQASYEAFLDRCASPFWRTVVLGARDDLLCDAHRRGQVYVETSNRLTFLAPALAASLPDSRFVHLHRHPYGYVRSAMRRGYYRGHHWDFARPVPRADDPFHSTWERLSPAERCAWLWTAVNEESSRFVGSLADERRLVLGADQLFAGDPADLAALFGLVGAGPPPAASVRRVLDRRLNAQEEGEFDLDAATRQEVDEIVGPLAARLGYALG